MERHIERISEDWLAVAIGLAVFALSLSTVAGLDLLGWAAAPKTWIDIDKAVQPAGPSPLGGVLALVLTYGFVLALMLLGVAALGANTVTFALSFTIIYWLAYPCWVLGNFAYLAVTTPADMEKFGIGWSLRLTGESGYLIALVLGLLIANGLPGKPKAPVAVSRDQQGRWRYCYPRLALGLLRIAYCFSH